MPTQEQVTKYVKDNDDVCPGCGSHDVEWGEISIDGRYVYQKCSCNYCNFQWHDCYTLTGIFDDANEVDIEAKL